MTRDPVSLQALLLVSFMYFCFVWNGTDMTNCAAAAGGATGRRRIGCAGGAGLVRCPYKTLRRRRRPPVDCGERRCAGQGR